MAHTFPELKHKTLAELKEIAAAITPAVAGYTQMNKDHLLEAICKALNIDMHVHHEVKGIDKPAVKAKIRFWSLFTPWKARRQTWVPSRVLPIVCATR